MMTAGKRRRAWLVVTALLLVAAFMHLAAFPIVGFGAIDPHVDRSTLAIITGCGLLSWSLMMSQAMESVTRAFYSRSDLDLILSSPIQARRVFAVRIATIAASTMIMALFLAAPFINVLIYRGGPRWLSAYGVVVAIGATAAALSVALTVALFRTIGPKRTRLVAQIVAAIVGAAFVIGLQVSTIFAYGTLSYVTFLKSDLLISFTPSFHSAVWWPARAVLGDFTALAAVLSLSMTLLIVTTAIFSVRFGEHAIAAAGVSYSGVFHRRSENFHRFSPRGALRHKEWVLLRRDPWLASQTLMQLLYLLPPALLLWRAFGNNNGDLVLLVPVLVMAAGQLAGGLAWLAISGEDAPDLVATAPIAPHWIIRAKIEAVIGAVALMFSPFLIILTLLAPSYALAAMVGIGVSATSATTIQLWFRSQARRKNFRRRHTSSRIATYAEAFSSIIWAATAGLAAAGHWQAAVTALIAIVILAVVRAISPRQT